MLEFRNITFSYVKDVMADKQSGIRNINIKIPKGQVVLLCGESGCGKTTLTRLSNGLIPHYYEGDLEGEVIIDGKVVADNPLYDLTPLIGSVFQNPRSQFFNVDTTSELAFACENLGMEEDVINERVASTVTEFKIEKLMDRSIFAMSGGEKQKIACASVSVASPDIYVLDEPSSNLDVASIRELAKIIEYWKKAGKTILISEHRLYYLLDLADRVIYMQAGSVAFDIGIDEFKQFDSEKLVELGLRSLNPTVLSTCSEPHLNKWCKIKDMRFTYGKERFLEIPEVLVPKGAIIAVLGNNGAGKTTFGRMLCGLNKKGQGDIEIDGITYNRKRRRRNCYMVMQDVNRQLFTESVLDEIMISMPGNDEKKNQADAMEILESLNLLAERDIHPMALSGGQKQRVAIGSAAASDKELFVFDEPTSGLDYRHMLEVAGNIKKLGEPGKTCFVITHDNELVMHSCNYYLFFEEGIVKKQGNLFGQDLKEISEFFS